MCWFSCTLLFTFASHSTQAALRIFPSLVPISPTDPAAADNRAAWEVLKRYQRPLMTAFSDKDPITRGADKVWHKLVPGAKNQKHVTLKGGGHFLQEVKDGWLDGSAVTRSQVACCSHVSLHPQLPNTTTGTGRGRGASPDGALLHPSYLPPCWSCLCGG